MEVSCDQVRRVITYPSRGRTPAVLLLVRIGHPESFLLYDTQDYFLRYDHRIIALSLARPYCSMTSRFASSLELLPNERAQLLVLIGSGQEILLIV